MMVFSGSETAVVIIIDLFMIFFSDKGKAMTLSRKLSLEKEPRRVCDTRSCIHAAAILLSHMDSSQDPCENFYAYACGGFQTKYLALDREIHVDVFLDKQMRPILKKMLTSDDREDDLPIIKKMKAFYASCINIENLPHKGMQGLQKILDEYGGWPLLMGDSWNKTDFSWQDATANLVSRGLSIVSILGVDVYYNLHMSPSDSYRIIQIRSPYVLNKKEKVRESYQKLMEDVAIYLGAPKDTVYKDVEDIMEFLVEYTNVVLDVKNTTKDEDDDFDSTLDDDLSSENMTMNDTSDFMSEARL